MSLHRKDFLSGERTNATIGSKGDCIIPTTLEENVVMLHELLYAEEDYMPSKQVIGLSEEIMQQTADFIQ